MRVPRRASRDRDRGECANGFEAVKAVTELKPDLLFLDIQMPKLDGFEVLELIGNEVAVIFVTAYDEFALRAFEVHAVDYLLKPFSAERLGEALEHAKHRLGRAPASPGQGGRGLGASARGAGTANPGARRPARARDPRGQAGLRPGAGRLRLPALGGEGGSQGADARGAGSHPGSDPLRADSPVVRPQHRAARAGRALRQGQPHRDSRATAPACPSASPDTRASALL